MSKRKLPSVLPERLDAVIRARGHHPITKAKREVWENAKFGIKLVVTWAPPFEDVGLQQYTCKHLPVWQFTNYEALRKQWAIHFAEEKTDV